MKTMRILCSAAAIGLVLAFSTAVVSAQDCGGCAKPCAGSKKKVQQVKSDCGKKPCGTCGKDKADISKPCSCGTKKTQQAKSDKGTACSSCSKTKSGCGQARTAADSGCAGCPIRKKADAVLASMPAMEYRVGSERTGCSKHAASLAKGNGHAIEYVVGEKTYSAKGEAVAKLVSLLDEEIESLQKIKYVAGGKAFCCSKSAGRAAKKTDTTIVYRVAGFDFDTQEKAETALESIHEALENVSLTYKVGGESLECGKTAGANAKEMGEKLVYVIGDQETGCKKTAGLLLTEAKVKAAVDAAAHVTAPGS